VREAIIQHLRRVASESDPWEVEFELTEDQARQIGGAEKNLVAEGGTSPFVGGQRFLVRAPSQPTPVQLNIDARVTLPPMTVIAVRSLPRGAIVHVSDVKLERGRDQNAGGDGFARLDDVVGKEVARSVAAGQLVHRDALRAPLVVKRGEVVTVYARQAGLVVRTTARARDDGSLGDVITVESLLNRQTFFARASGIQEVEIFAHAIDASPPVRGAIAPSEPRDLARQERQERNRP
jgi:flagella basal body P-ring formation protein FlgA